MNESGLGEVLHEFGGVNRGPPLRLWQVGHILTKRDINSFGTLGRKFWSVKIKKRKMIYWTFLVYDDLLNNKSIVVITYHE